MKSFFRTVIFILFCFIILSGIISRLKKSNSNLEHDRMEVTSADSLGVSHTRLWEDQYFNYDFTTSYCLTAKQNEVSQNLRNDFEPPIDTYWHYKNYWGSIYKFLVDQDSNALRAINDSLFHVGKTKMLDRYEFAHMLVAFVQDIPYSYVVPKECTAENDGHPCLPNQKFGIVSPVEFLYSLYGDCDTRTTLLYTLLKHFGYNVIVLISNEYAHAMLGVEIPTTGNYIRHKGKKFYFWETTGTGWRPGLIPRKMNNLQYWEIALDYE